MLFHRFRFFWLYFLWEEDGAGESAPVELFHEVVVFIDRTIFLSFTAYGDHITSYGDGKVFRTYTCHHRLDHDLCGGLIDIDGELAFFIGLFHPALGFLFFHWLYASALWLDRARTIFWSHFLVHVMRIGELDAPGQSFKKRFSFVVEHSF